MSTERQIHKCNVCGSESLWTADHGHIERGVGTGFAAYEIAFIICSQECREKTRPFFISWLSAFDGWTKKKATENYDKFVTNN
jgi:hypothetical protein